MALTPETRVFSRRMFRICLVLAVVMMLVTVYWWMLWDSIWLSPVSSVEEAFHGRSVTGILAQLWPLSGISPAKLVTRTSSLSFAWVTLALVSWTRFWLKTSQGNAKKEKPDSPRSYIRVAVFTTVLLSVMEGVGPDTAAALLPVLLILLPLEFVWRYFSRTHQPVRL